MQIIKYINNNRIFGFTPTIISIIVMLTLIFFFFVGLGTHTLATPLWGLGLGCPGIACRRSVAPLGFPSSPFRQRVLLSPSVFCRATASRSCGATVPKPGNCGCDRRRNIWHGVCISSSASWRTGDRRRVRRSIFRDRLAAGAAGRSRSRPRCP